MMMMMMMMMITTMTTMTTKTTTTMSTVMVFMICILGNTIFLISISATLQKIIGDITEHNKQDNGKENEIVVSDGYEVLAPMK